MANPTMTLIGSPIVVGSGGVSSVTFSSIPSTYTDLVVKVSARGSAAAININTTLTFNGSSTGYSEKLLQGNGSSAGSYSAAAFNWASDANGASSTANTFNNGEIYIPNYASSNYKSASVDVVVENNASGGFDNFDAALWSNTAAITSITLTGSSSYVQYSTFYLYGVSNS